MKIVELIQSKKFTVILGKNGAGKSTALRAIDANSSLNTRYITPERGGVLTYEPNIDQTIAQNVDWLANTRRQNRTENFRQQSAVQFRNLEMLTLREIEKDPARRSDLSFTFDSVISDLSEHLPAIALRRSDRGFTIVSRDGVDISENQISSGEAEFIALAIEVLVYSKSATVEKVLLLDEPDVHLHPDLQAKFIQFLQQIAQKSDIRVVIATHSTAIISAFSEDADLQIVPVSARDQSDFEGFTRSKMVNDLLPIFGAHPLSFLFNKFPILLLEGEDDKRVFEQVVRSSVGRVKVNPCAVGSVDEMNAWEVWLEKFLPVLYDSPVALSLRDLDSAQDNG